ncbi:hypothetical protein GCM10010501_52270 [Streptomyces libani subsp. rufus]|nr:hypothetical protein GCM10010501_52270 [Streptomyces libani subsp. rufus]
MKGTEGVGWRGRWRLAGGGVVKAPPPVLAWGTAHTAVWLPVLYGKAMPLSAHAQALEQRPLPDELDRSTARPPTTTTTPLPGEAHRRAGRPLGVSTRHRLPEPAPQPSDTH